MRSHRVRLPDLLASVLFLASCVGRIDGEGEVPSEAGDSTNPTPSGGQGSTRPSLAGQPSATAGQPPVGGPTAPPGAMPLRRLTKLELANTVRDLLSIPDVQAPASLPPDVLADNGFLVGGSTSRVEAEIFMEWTGRLATAAVAQPDRILPCQPIPSGRTAEDSCAQKFIAEFGLRAFRRPLTKGEIDELFGYCRDQLQSALGYDFVGMPRLTRSRRRRSPPCIPRLR